MKFFPPFRDLRLILSSTACMGVAALLNSCGSMGGSVVDTGYGPFDSRGNYVEDWADTPEKWSRRASYASQTAAAGLEPELAMSQSSTAPPSDLIPIASGSSRPVEVTSLKRSGAAASRSIASNSTRSTATKSQVKSTASRPRTKVVKPNATRVVIRRGDTLSGLAAKHRSSVRAIQRANGMRDTKLVAGKTLLIPRL